MCRNGFRTITEDQVREGLRLLNWVNGLNTAAASVRESSDSMLIAIRTGIGCRQRCGLFNVGGYGTHRSGVTIKMVATFGARIHHSISSPAEFIGGCADAG